MVHTFHRVFRFVRLNVKITSAIKIVLTETSAFSQPQSISIKSNLGLLFIIASLKTRNIKVMFIAADSVTKKLTKICSN